jgi:hypothetical protein
LLVLHRVPLHPVLIPIGSIAKRFLNNQTLECFEAGNTFRGRFRLEGWSFWTMDTRIVRTQNFPNKQHLTPSPRNTAGHHYGPFKTTGDPGDYSEVIICVLGWKQRLICTTHANLGKKKSWFKLSSSSVDSHSIPFCNFATQVRTFFLHFCTFFLQDRLTYIDPVSWSRRAFGWDLETECTSRILRRGSCVTCGGRSWNEKNINNKIFKKYR